MDKNKLFNPEHLADFSGVWSHAELAHMQATAIQNLREFVSALDEKTEEQKNDIDNKLLVVDNFLSSVVETIDTFNKALVSLEARLVVMESKAASSVVTTP